MGGAMRRLFRSVAQVPLEAGARRCWIKTHGTTCCGFFLRPLSVANDSGLLLLDELAHIADELLARVGIRHVEHVAGRPHRCPALCRQQRFDLVAIDENER